MNGRREAVDWLAERDSLHVASLCAQTNERLGYPPESAYVETFWLPLIGPSATLLLRRLSAWLEPDPNGFSVPIAVLGRYLGLGTGTGRHSPTVRTLARLTNFALAAIEDDVYRVRGEVPMLDGRQLARLPSGLVTAHERLIQGSTRGMMHTTPRRASATVQALTVASPPTGARRGPSRR